MYQADIWLDQGVGGDYHGVVKWWGANLIAAD